MLEDDLADEGLIELEPTLATGDYAYSASQVDTEQMCSRRWAFDKIARIPRPPPGESQRKGIKIHGILEAYQKGTPIDFSSDEGYRAQSATHLLPPPNTGVAEGFFRFTRRGHSYVGYIDLEVPPGHGLEGRDPGCWLFDYKSTSNVNGEWVKTPEILQTDPQATIYSYWLMAKYKVPVINLQWTFIQSKKTVKSKPVITQRHSKQVVEEFKKIDAQVDKMDRLRLAKVNPLSLPPNLDACDKFPPDKCPYLALCHKAFTPEQKRAAIFGDPGPARVALPIFQTAAPPSAPTPRLVHSGSFNPHAPSGFIVPHQESPMSTVLDRLRAEQAARAAGAAPTAPATPPTAIAIPAPVAYVPPVPLPAPPAPIPPVAAPPGAGTGPDLMAMLAARAGLPAPGQINPPEATPPIESGYQPPASPLAALQAAAPTPAQPAARRGPGRPPKAESAGEGPVDVTALALQMHEARITKIVFDGSKILEMQVALEVAK